MAHIQKRAAANGPRWRVVYRIDGKQVTDTFANERGAAEYAALVDRIGGKAAREVLGARRGSRGAGKLPTVAQALEQHVDALTGITEGTRRDYRKMAANIAASNLGPLPVDAVTEQAVARWVDAQKVSAKTIRNRHGLLYAAMRRQVKAGAIAVNPCEDTRIRRTERQTEMTTLTPNEFWTIHDHLGEHWRPLAVTLVGTGLRFGEATALQVRDLDLDGEPPTLRVARAWQHTDGPERELGPPKTERGRRLVSLPDEVVGVLRPIVTGRHREAFVFVNKRGAPIRQNSFHEIWTRALDDADIGKRPRIHDLRHTHVSWLIAQGVSLAVIQRRLGHEDIRTTVNTYGHMADDALSVAAQAASVAMAPVLREVPASDADVSLKQLEQG